MKKKKTEKKKKIERKPMPKPIPLPIPTSLCFRVRTALEHVVKMGIRDRNADRFLLVLLEFREHSSEQTLCAVVVSSQSFLDARVSLDFMRPHVHDIRARPLVRHACTGTHAVIVVASCLEPNANANECGTKQRANTITKLRQCEK